MVMITRLCIQPEPFAASQDRSPSEICASLGVPFLWSCGICSAVRDCRDIEPTVPLRGVPSRGVEATKEPPERSLQYLGCGISVSYLEKPNIADCMFAAGLEAEAWSGAVRLKTGRNSVLNRTDPICSKENDLIHHDNIAQWLVELDLHTCRRCFLQGLRMRVEIRNTKPQIRRVI